MMLLNEFIIKWIVLKNAIEQIEWCLNHGIKWLFAIEFESTYWI